MAKTVVSLALSFDGYVAGLHDEIEWIESVHSSSDAIDETSGWNFEAFISQVGAIVMGKRSYEMGVERGWYKNQAYGPSPIFVLCKNAPKKPSKDADFRFVTTGAVDAYKQTKAAAGNKIIYVFGGASIVQQFLNEDLIDEMIFGIVPVMLGKGIRLFDNLKERQVKLKQLEVKGSSNGFALLHYKIIK